MEGVTADEYQKNFGVEAVEGGVELAFVKQTDSGSSFGSRLYMLDDENKYKMFRLKNREFSLEVDVSSLPCGLNGAVYFVEMNETGGQGTGHNQAGAEYGLGYCSAQCPHDVKFIDGEANLLSWNATADPPAGRYGACCAEMDIWQANSMASAFTPHPCTHEGPLRCDGTECGDTERGERYSGLCDKDGCDFNSFRMGNKSFYGVGSGFSVDTTRPLTVVTQFITHDGTISCYCYCCDKYYHYY